ncbi:unnamed protein product [Bursaphelenchus xylophilus]|uniref:(pine wood nematode) hypothetical protein n=1 Tax=Bursaphelenchus xylophilus TaxID=6326 RepID=A0A1I7RTN3_BURXY|nr:unnamed protein product [Bursaphelenchus xylophilus]CAG9122283.1 unnamed protein product [Bursaphelenchus xylophilus]
MSSYEEEEDQLPPLPQELVRVPTPDSNLHHQNENGNGLFAQFVEDLDKGVPEEKIHDFVYDYLIGEGMGDVAQLLAQESGYPLPPDETLNIEKLAERNQIREAIQDGRILEAIDRIKELCPGMLENDKEFHFIVLRQHLVEVIRKKDDDEALDFAQKYLADKCDNNTSREQMSLLEQTYALLAFEKPEESPFGHLMHSSQKQMLAHVVNQKILTHLGVTPQTRFEKLLKIMVWNQSQIAGKGDIGLNIPQSVINQQARDLFDHPDDAEEEDPEESFWRRYSGA